MACTRTEGGFTLVELGFCLLIIGAFIGTVLKGVELLENARVVATINQIKEIETASAIFQNKYRGVPGDIEDPENRISNCVTDQCKIAGNGDGYVDLSSDPKESNAWSTSGESRNYWLHLVVTGMLSGVNGLYTGTPNKFGVDFPATPMGGGWQIQSFIENGRKRTYMTLVKSFVTPNDIEGRRLSAAQVHQIDMKIDDGYADRGHIRGYNDATHGVCTRAGETDMDRNAYLSDNTEQSACNLWVIMSRRM